MPDDFATDPPADDLFPSEPAAEGETQGGDDRPADAPAVPPAPEPEKPKRRTRARLTEPAKPKPAATQEQTKDAVAGHLSDPAKLDKLRDRMDSNDVVDGDGNPAHRPTVATSLADENEQLRRRVADLEKRLSEPRDAARAEPPDAGDDSLALYECHMPADKSVKPVRVRAKTKGDAKEQFLRAIGAFATENEIRVREVG